LDELGHFADEITLVEGEDDYSEEEGEEESQPYGFYFAMELLKDHLFESEDIVSTAPFQELKKWDSIPPITLKSNWRQFVAALFELYMTLVLTEDAGYAHEDLGTHNILYTLTDQVRSYQINGQNYLVRSQYLPKIIDWSPHVGSHHASEPKASSDRLLYFLRLQGMYPEEMAASFEDFSRHPSFEHPIFDELREDLIQETDKNVKYYDQVEIEE
jgi:hypothetical protein